MDDTSLRQKTARVINAYFITLCILFFVQGCSKNESKAVDAVSNEELDAAIHLAADYLVNSVKDDGMFVYRVNMNHEVFVADRYNILRHAGTIYAMSQYHETYGGTEMLNAMKKSGSYLRDNEMFAIPGNENIFAIWSRPEINKARAPLQAKLGGTGLGLVALTSIEKIEPGFVEIEDLRRLGDFILYMQKEDGSFYSKYFAEDGRSDAWTSLYYPGEAALGLVTLYEIDPDKRWIEGAISALSYLAESRKGQPVEDIPADHWALIATEKLFSIEGQPEAAEKLKLLKDHVVQVSESILASQILTGPLDPLHGGFSVAGRTTPTATRLEGLLAARILVQEESDLAGRIDEAVNTGIEFLLKSQVTSEGFAGGIPRVSPVLYSTSDIGLDERAGEIRVDYVQHFLSALIQTKI